MRQVRGRRPVSARRLRLTSSFDDGCSGRERVSTPRIDLTPHTTTTTTTSSTSCETHNAHKQLDTSSTRNQPQKPRLRSSSLSRTGANNSISNSTGSLRDQMRSGALKDELQGLKESRMNSSRSTAKQQNSNAAQCSASSNIAKKLLNISNEKETASSKRQLARPALPVRRTSLDMKSQDGDKQTTGRLSTPQRARHHDQTNCKAGAPPGSVSANSSPRLRRRGPVQSNGNVTWSRQRDVSTRLSQPKTTSTTSRRSSVSGSDDSSFAERTPTAVIMSTINRQLSQLNSRYDGTAAKSPDSTAGVEKQPAAEESRRRQTSVIRTTQNKTVEKATDNVRGTIKTPTTQTVRKQSTALHQKTASSAAGSGSHGTRQAVNRKPQLTVSVNCRPTKCNDEVTIAFHKPTVSTDVHQNASTRHSGPAADTASHRSAQTTGNTNHTGCKTVTSFTLPAVDEATYSSLI